MLASLFGFFFYTTIVLFIFVCVVLILLVLIQKGRGGGLASAFGGSGGNTAFGAKTGDVLTWATSVVFGVFLLLAIALNLFANKRHQDAMASSSTYTAPAPPATAPSSNSPLQEKVPAMPEPTTNPAPAQ